MRGMQGAETRRTHVLYGGTCRELTLEELMLCMGGMLGADTRGTHVCMGDIQGADTRGTHVIYGGHVGSCSLH